MVHITFNLELGLIADDFLAWGWGWGGGGGGGEGGGVQKSTFKEFAKVDQDLIFLRFDVVNLNIYESGFRRLNPSKRRCCVHARSLDVYTK